jgi:hypothetical protein
MTVEDILAAMTPEEYQARTICIGSKLKGGEEYCTILRDLGFTSSRRTGSFLGDVVYIYPEGWRAIDNSIVDSDHNIRVIVDSKYEADLKNGYYNAKLCSQPYDTVREPTEEEKRVRELVETYKHRLWDAALWYRYKRTRKYAAPLADRSLKKAHKLYKKIDPIMRKKYALPTPPVHPKHCLFFPLTT